MVHCENIVEIREPVKIGATKCGTGLRAQSLNFVDVALKNLSKSDYKILRVDPVSGRDN